MAFFSGLKAAYDSIGSEINKTFDSSKDGGAQDISTSPEEHSDTTTPQPLDKASKLGEVESVPSSTHTTPSKEGETKALSTNQHRKEESDPFMSNWGEWEQQTTRQNRIKSPSLKQTQPSTSSLSPELADSRETTPILKTTSHSTVVGTPSSEGGISADLPGTSSDDKSKLPLATSTPSRMQSSSSSSGKSQLDNLSREDLIKYVRKQGLLLQKSKNRCEDLTKECERLQEMGGGSKNAEEGGGVLGEELQVVRSERDSAVMEGKSLRQTVTQLGNEKQDLADRLEALNDAHSKLKQLFQERQSTTTSSEQEPTPPSPEEKVTESRSENQTLESMVTSLKQQLEEGGLEFSNQLEQLKKDKQSVESKYADLLRRAKKLQTELKSSREKIVSQEPLNEEKIKALEGKNEQLVSDLATARQDLQTNQERFVLDSDGLKKKMEETELACSQFKQRLVESEGREKDLRKELEEVSSKVILVGNDLAATKVGEENLKKKLEETKSELTALERSHATSVESEESLNKELEELRSKYSQLEANFTKRALDDNALKEELKELTLRNSQLEQSLLAEKKIGESDGNVVQEENQGRAMELEDKCQQLVCQLEDAQEKLAEMEARVKSTEQDKALAQEKLAEMEARVKSTEQDKALAQEKLVEMEARVKSTEQDKALAQEKLAEMEARVESTEQDKALAQEKLAEMEARVESTEQDKALAQEKLAEMEARVESTEQDKALAQEKLAEMEARVESTEQDKALAQEKLAEMEARVESTEQDKALAQEKLAEMEARVESTEQDKALAQEKLAEMEARVESTEQDKALAQEKLAEMEARVESTEQDKALAQEKLAEMEARVESTEQDKALAQEKLAEMEAKTEDKFRNSEGEKAILQDKLDEMEATVTNVEKEKALTQEKELPEIEARIKNIEQDNSLLQDNLTKKDSQLKEMDSSLKSTMEELESARRVNSEASEMMRSERARFESELSRISSSNVDLDGRLKTQTDEVKAMGIKLTELEQRCVHKDQQLSTADEELANLRSLLESREKDLNDQLKEAVSLKAELEQRCDHNDQQLSTANKELANLRSLLESREKDLNDQLEEVVSLKEEMKQRVNKESEDHVDGNTSENLVLQERSNLECERLKETLASMEVTVEEREGEKEALKKEIEELRATLEKEAASHKEESRKLKAFAMKLNETRGSLSIDNDRLKTNEKSLIKEKIKLKRNVKSLEKERDMAEDRLKIEQTLRDLIEKLRQRNKELEEQLKDLCESQESSTTQKQLQEAKASSDEIKELKSKLSEEMEKLKQTHSSQTSILQAKNDEASSLIGQLSAEGSRLQLRVIELEDGREVMQSELASLQADLATVTSEGNAQKMATESALSEVRASKEDLEKERGAHRETKQKLVLLEKEAKSSSLMSMELEDYQKSIRAMEGGLAGKEQQLEETRRTSLLHQDSLQQLRKDMDSVTLQKTQSEETVIKLKQLVMKNKKEVVEGRRKEEELQKTISELQTQLEEERQGSEMAKMEASQITARIQSIKQQSEQSLGNLQRAHRTLEQRYALAQGELTTTKTALTNTRTDYENYKVRVHSVLKQKSTGPGQAQINTEIKQKYESELVKLTTELQEVKSRFSSSQADHEDLLLEHEQLSSRHEQLLQEAEERRERLEKAMKDEASRHSLQSQEQTELIIQLRHEMEEMAVIFKTQLNSLQEEHAKVVSSLKEDLEAAHANLSRLQHEVDSRVLAKSTASSVTHPEGGSHLPNMEVKKIPNEQRSSGEGMEQSELDSTTSSIPPTPLFEDTSLSFERLLSAGESDVGSNQKQALLVSASEGNLRKQLKAALKKIKHLTELLRENEASSLRLSDQAKLLKEEIRRLERNKEREKEVANMEYLKNIVLKFLHDGSERTALIPIIEKLLLLSPKEVKYLEDTIVKGKPSKLPDADPEGGAPSAKNTNWSSYVHRWTGY